MDYTKDDTITIDLSGFTDSGPSGSWDPYYGAIPPNVTIASGIYSTATTMPDITILDSTPSPTITLRGEDADININGVSLMDTIRGIQDRLNILCPDPEMEQEWHELRALREQYDAKLAECREKSKVWKALKS